MATFAPPTIADPRAQGVGELARGGGGGVTIPERKNPATRAGLFLGLYQRLRLLTHAGFRPSTFSDSLAREDSRHACIGEIADGLFG